MEVMLPAFRSLKLVIRCADLEASRSFYTGILGLTLIGQWEEPQGRGLILSAGGALPEIYEMRPADPRFDPPFRQPVAGDKIDLQLEADSAEAWAGHLRGRWPFEGPEHLPWGQRWIKLRDPDGLLIAIYTAVP